MNIRTRVERLETAARPGIRVVILQNGETEEEARRRLGISPGACVVFLTETDVEL
jgi:hypothetical protein